MSKDKKSFLIFKDSLPVLDELSNEQAGLLFKAIKSYQNDEDIELDSLTKIIFSPFKAQFDRDNEKYQKIVERNKNNGLKGGRPKTEANQKNPDKPSGLSKNPKNPSKADSDSDSDSDTKKNDRSVDQSRAEILEKSFNWFWKIWKGCKKQRGKTDTSPKKNTFDKKWKVIFNQSYFKNHSEEQFKQEINKMASFCKEAHNVSGFNRFENMQLPKFLNEKQWRD